MTAAFRRWAMEGPISGFSVPDSLFKYDVRDDDTNEFGHVFETEGTAGRDRYLGVTALRA